MAYSISFYLKPESLELIDSVSDGHVLAFLKQLFEEDYQRNHITPDGLFSYVKPRGREAWERKCFDALGFLHQQGLVNEISADDWNSEPSIIEKLKKYQHTELIPISKDE
ncbi:hypothetical protein Lepto7375DRAFT_7246 [Leptolyngbya sp. PCC 7375]|nr:hypothetical protein Lepto7375DRAFT_7246 [Leptolyngbya sp. PCC 7375]